MSEFIGWLQNFGLATDGSVDQVDSDGDKLSNWQEWRCGTDPTNGASALRLLAPQASSSNILVQWQSVGGINYFLQRSTNLFDTPPFQPLATNLPGGPGMRTYTDTNPPAQSPVFYRVGVGN